MGADPLTIQLSGYRVALEMSQQQVAEQLGISRQALSQYESGKTRISLPTAAAYARVVGARLAVVVDEDGCE